MRLSNTIERVVSAFLIIVFALSITPVIVLHSLAANHKDVSFIDHHKKGEQLSKSGINCNCIDFVAEAQFLNDFTVINITSGVSFSVFNAHYYKAFYSRPYFDASLRGPPFAA